MAEDIQTLQFRYSSYLEQAKELEEKGDFYNSSRQYFLAAKELVQIAKLNGGEHSSLGKAQFAHAKSIVDKAELVKSWAEKQISSWKGRPPRVKKSPSGKDMPSPTYEENHHASDDEKKKVWLAAEKPNVSFDDVIGLEEAKREIFQNFIDPIAHPELFASYGLKGGKGLLLYGPPGTGKTTLAKAVAHEINARFYPVQPSELLSKWVGESEQNLASLFEAAKEDGAAVIYLDDCDALLKAREGNSPHDNRLMSEFLQQLDGFSGRKADLFLLAATNIPWALDPAILRGGRIDVKVYVGLPNDQARRLMIERFLNKNKNGVDEEFNIDTLVEVSRGLGGGDIMSSLDHAAREAAYRKLRLHQSGAIRMKDIQDSLLLAKAGRSNSETSEERYAAWGGFSLTK